MQKLGPSGVFEGELVRVHFECIPDRCVHDGLCPLAKWSLGGGGLDKLSIALTQGEADRANPFNMQTREGRWCESLAKGELSPELEVSFEGILEVTLKVPFVVGQDVVGRSRELRTRKLDPFETSDDASVSSSS